MNSHKPQKGTTIKASPALNKTVKRWCPNGCGKKVSHVKYQNHYWTPNKFRGFYCPYCKKAWETLEQLEKDLEE